MRSPAQALSPEWIAERTARRCFTGPIIENSSRGDIAETIAEVALAPHWRLCSGGWSGWDLEHRDTTRLQVKQSAAQQTWTAERRSPPSYSIPKAKGRWGNNGGGHIPFSEPWRCADIYLFMYHPGVGVGPDIDQRDPKQWAFYVIKTTDLPEKNSITLNEVRRLSRPYQHNTVRRAVEALRRSLPPHDRSRYENVSAEQAKEQISAIARRAVAARQRNRASKQPLLGSF